MVFNVLMRVGVIGLYNWFNNDLSEALKFFNCVKHDPEWGQQALHNMVEIYLASNEQETAETLLQVCGTQKYFEL